MGQNKTRDRNVFSTGTASLQPPQSRYPRAHLTMKKGATGPNYRAEAREVKSARKNNGWWSNTAAHGRTNSINTARGNSLPVGAGCYIKLSSSVAEPHSNPELFSTADPRHRLFHHSRPKPQGFSATSLCRTNTQAHVQPQTFSQYGFSYSE